MPEYVHNLLFLFFLLTIRHLLLLPYPVGFAEPRQNGPAGEEDNTQARGGRLEQLRQSGGINAEGKEICTYVL